MVVKYRETRQKSLRSARPCTRGRFRFSQVRFSRAIPVFVTPGQCSDGRQRLLFKYSWMPLLLRPSRVSSRLYHHLSLSQAYAIDISKSYNEYQSVTFSWRGLANRWPILAEVASSSTSQHPALGRINDTNAKGRQLQKFFVPRWCNRENVFNLTMLFFRASKNNFLWLNCAVTRTWSAFWWKHALGDKLKLCWSFY